MQKALDQFMLGDIEVDVVIGGFFYAGSHLAEADRRFMPYKIRLRWVGTIVNEKYHVQNLHGEKLWMNIEDVVANSISHEYLHIAISLLEGEEASKKFDNVCDGFDTDGI